MARWLCILQVQTVRRLVEGIPLLHSFNEGYLFRVYVFLPFLSSFSFRVQKYTQQFSWEVILFVFFGWRNSKTAQKPQNSLAFLEMYSLMPNQKVQMHAFLLLKHLPSPTFLLSFFWAQRGIRHQCNWSFTWATFKSESLISGSPLFWYPSLWIIFFPSPHFASKFSSYSFPLSVRCE